MKRIVSDESLAHRIVNESRSSDKLNIVLYFNLKTIKQLSGIVHCWRYQSSPKNIINICKSSYNTSWNQTLSVYKKETITSLIMPPTQDELVDRCDMYYAIFIGEKKVPCSIPYKNMDGLETFIQTFSPHVDFQVVNLSEMDIDLNQFIDKFVTYIWDMIA